MKTWREIWTGKRDPNTELLDAALAEIALDARLSPRQKLARQREVFQDYRAVTGQVVTTRGYANQTSYGRTFGQSLMRRLASALVGLIFAGSRR
jgi:hypothetical protein